MESIPISAASHHRPVAGATFICPECAAILMVGAHPEYYLKSIIEAIAEKLEPPAEA
jgi:acetone carboxylase gamma subunit